MGCTTAKKQSEGKNKAKHSESVDGRPDRDLKGQRGCGGVRGNP
jgi:hypothetical protein